MKVFLKKHGDKLLFALTLVFLAAAFFRKETTWLPIETPAITFTQWWESDLDKDTLRTLVKEFEALHGGIKVTLNYRSYEDLRRDLFASAEIPPGTARANSVGANGVGANKIGDVVALDPLWVPELLKMGIIENRDFTLFSFVDVLYYNVSILKEAGFSRPPKTRSEFLNYARTLTTREGTRPTFALGIALNANNTRGIYDDIFPWIWAAGVPLIKDRNPMVTSRQVIESLSYLAALNSEGLIAPDAFLADNAKKLEDFTSGRTAFMVAPALYIAQVTKHMGDDAFGITSIPAPDNYFGEPFLATAGWAFGIHSASPQLEEARLFADFLAANASLLSDKTGALPKDGAPPARDPFYSKVWDITITGDSARDFAGLPWMELEVIFRDGLYSLFGARFSPTEIATTIQEKLRNR